MKIGSHGYTPINPDQRPEQLRPASTPPRIAPAPPNSTPGSPDPAGNAPAELPLKRDSKGLELDLDSQMQKARLAQLAGSQFAGLSFNLKSLKALTGGLKTPKPEVVAKLNKALQKAKSDFAAAASGTKDQQEAARKEMDKALREIADAYGVNLKHTTGLEFDPRLKDLDAGTIGQHPRTFIVVGESALSSAEAAASTILHESTHAWRNKELADRGVDRGKFNPKQEDIYDALIEVEAYQMEIANAKKLGTSDDYVKEAESRKKGYLKKLKDAGGEEWSKLAEQGRFNELYKKF